MISTFISSMTADRILDSITRSVSKKSGRGTNGNENRYLKRNMDTKSERSSRSSRAAFDRRLGIGPVRVHSDSQ